MLALPEVGIARSVRAHNVELDIVCDWIEGTVLFNEDTVSKASIVDVLCENHVYDSQTFAFEMVDNAFRELKRREAWLGAGSAFSVVGNSVDRIHVWKDRPAHSFCVALSFLRWYPSWARTFGKDHTEQGALFEDLSAASARAMLSDWEIHHTGWTRTATRKINEIVKEVAHLVHESIGEVHRWTKPTANEAGLDLLCYRTFDDNRAGIPVYLMQCASGGNYEEKLHTPNLKVWKRIVQFTAEPRKAFAMPFSLTDEEFTRVCNLVDGMLLDRYRLLAPGRTDPNWVTDPLKAGLIAWTEPRIATLPLDT